MRTHIRHMVGVARVAVTGMVLAFGALTVHRVEAVDPATVVGADQCAECHNHQLEAQAWQATKHQKRFRDEPMHRLDSAKAIADKLGIRRVTSDERCMTCHYTSEASGSGRVRAVSGVSCESCHGGAKEWVKIHNDFGEGVSDPSQESPEHARKRIAACDAAGMNRRGEIQAIAANCFGCHTVPNEEIVNVGGHTAGSDFELVAWLSGEVRHNFSAGTKNEEAPKGADPSAYRRRLYVVGRATDLEYALRALAKATKAGPYVDSIQARIKRAHANLQAIVGAVAIDEVKTMIAAVDPAALNLENKATAQGLADKVAAAIGAFVAAHDGTNLAGLDGLLPNPDQYKGTPFEGSP